ncbi:fimbria/pilus outer membrane usher protein [Variovorax dokdonensis]|uniref:fimbria/pilus outer membrane usher protein n=1 Tax=Variovorax dokdonensis TaxID=344883 RepID=UPI003645C27A
MVLLSPVTHAVEFNSAFLKIDGSNEADLSQFAYADYTTPGNYLVDVVVNNQFFGRQTIRIVDGDESQRSLPCFSREFVSGLGLTSEVVKALQPKGADECIDIRSIDGASVRYVKGSGTLKLSIPQVAFEYSDPNYIPRERWSNGINGAVLDYHVMASTNKQRTSSDWTNSSSLRSYGTLGANFGAWRFRGDFQSRTKLGGSGGTVHSEDMAEFSRLYAYRAFPSIRATTSLGQNYLNSDIFDTFAYTGASIESDQRMLPPSLRGYAPLITGVARSNATVTVSQQGRVIYATKVSAGAFALQDVSASVQGALDVTVEEEDGTIQRFQAFAAAVPFLARRGELRYKAAVGRPRLFGGRGVTPTVTFAEAAYGLPMDATVYGGAIMASGYSSAALGLGKDLGAIGAISADATTSRATLWWNGQTRSGQSYRLNYSKRFEQLDTDLRFFGYRFSDRTYTTFSQFSGDPNSLSNAGSRQRVSLTLAKRLFDYSTFFSVDYASYWDRPAESRYGVTVARTIALGSLRNVGLNLSAFHTRGYAGNGAQVYFTATIPLGNGQAVTANVSSNSQGHTDVNGGFMGGDSNGFSYAGYGGTSSGKPMASGTVRKMTPTYQVSAQASTVSNSYTSASVQLDGSLVATRFGVIPHSNGYNGDTRLLVSTDGVAEVPLFGGQARTNDRGYAVIGSISPFNTYDARVNTNKLSLQTQVTHPVQRLVLTDGAIGYVHFDAAEGRNVQAVLALPDGKPLPFGASVVDLNSGKEVGIVGEDGLTYLTQIQSESKLVVRLSQHADCSIEKLPDESPPNGAPATFTCH